MYAQRLRLGSLAMAAQAWPGTRAVNHSCRKTGTQVLPLSLWCNVMLADGCEQWKVAQKETLIILQIKQPGKPSIQMVTEAGLIGKIDLNSEGVGVCLNAIKAGGGDEQRIPVHLGLRMALESRTASEAVLQLKQFGVASAAHILVADPTTAVGLEVSAETIDKVHPDLQGRLTHTNQFKLNHVGRVDTGILSDSEA